MKIDKYAQGTPCWVCLGTPDTDAGKFFYAELFGGEYDDAEMFPGMPDGPVVFNAKKGDDFVGVIAPQLGEGEESAAWMFNFAVDDVDSSVKRVAELGGSMIADPMDIGDQGRVAVAADPNGVEAILWQGKNHIGAGVVDADASFSWVQLLTRNMEASTGFYVDLFHIGRSSGPAPGGGVNDVLMVGSEPVAGIKGMPEDIAVLETPNHWIIYFRVDDIDAAVDRAIANGANTIASPTQLAHIGRIAVVSDPQGAVFGLVTPA